MTTPSPELQTFFEQKHITGQFRPAKWLKLLHRLSAMDEAGDSKRNGLMIAQLVLGGLAFLSLISLVFTIDAGLAPAALAIGAGAIVGIIILQVIKQKQKSSDLFNNLRLTAEPIVSLMREDILPGKKVSLDIDCKGPLHPHLITEKIPKPKRGRLPRIGTTFYTYPWMKGEATLKDQTRLAWEIVSIVRHRDITKRGSSGKIKYKDKYKTKHRVSLRANFPKSIYKPIANVPAHVSIIEKEQSWEVRVKKQEIQQGKNFEKKWMRPRTYLDAVSTAFRSMQLIS